MLVTVSSVALTAGASAADMRMKAPPARVVAATSWAGAYIGVNGGVAWNRAKFSDLGDPTCCQWLFAAGAPFWSPNKAGFTFGGQFGYNWQSGNIVYGLEADLNWVDGKAGATLPGLFGTGAATTELNWSATVRGRIGVATASSLFYVTGGLAVGHFRNSWDVAAAVPRRFNSSETRTGWTVGGGIEHMLTRNWTAKIEGLYADFGDWTINGAPGTFASTYRSRFAHTVTTVRGGLNWKW